jgi:hypothetical protein
MVKKLQNEASLEVQYFRLFSSSRHADAWQPQCVSPMPMLKARQGFGRYHKQLTAADFLGWPHLAKL